MCDAPVDRDHSIISSALFRSGAGPHHYIRVLYLRHLVFALEIRTSCLLSFVSIDIMCCDVLAGFSH